MFDKRFKRIRIFTAIPGQALGVDIVTPHGPLFLVGTGRDRRSRRFVSTGRDGMTCYSFGVGPLWAVYTRKRRPGHAWTVRAAEALNHRLHRA